LSINWGQTALASLMRGRLLPARVTHLEMVAPIDSLLPQPTNAKAHIEEVKNCPVHFYRYLYDRIGKLHHWGQRRKLRDEHLSAILHTPETLLSILYLDGVPAGFCERRLDDWPDLEIVYFGLMVEFQGYGWGRFFLKYMIDDSWQRQPDRLLIQTNTLDSPHALTLYQSLGFKPVLVRDVMMEAVR